jgi:hypothetical protein
MSSSPHLRTETVPVFETLCFLVIRIPDDVQSPDTQWFGVLYTAVSESFRLYQGPWGIHEVCDYNNVLADDRGSMASGNYDIYSNLRIWYHTLPPWKCDVRSWIDHWRAPYRSANGWIGNVWHINLSYKNDLGSRIYVSICDFSYSLKGWNKCTTRNYWI